MSLYKVKTVAIIFLLLASMGLSQSAFSLCVKTNDAVLRTGPGTKFPVSWRVGRHTPLLDVESKPGWFKVQDLDGATHWIAKTNVTKSYQCMAVQVSLAALRVGPGTDKAYAQLPSVGRYYAFKRIDFEPPWYHVEDEKRGKYWVHENLVWQPLKRSRINF